MESPGRINDAQIMQRNIGRQRAGAKRIGGKAAMRRSKSNKAAPGTALLVIQ